MPRPAYLTLKFWACLCHCQCSRKLLQVRPKRASLRAGIGAVVQSGFMHRWADCRHSRQHPDSFRKTGELPLHELGVLHVYVAICAV